MRFLCICLSPAIDATVRMDAWPTEDCVIKNALDTFAPGGKTVNVARWLAKRGATVACGGLLGEDCWIGGHVTICPGVTIGSRSIVAAGSVVVDDVPEDVMVAGNPARIKKSLKCKV